MREIKFRAWDGEQMISPDYITRDGTAWWKADSIPTTSRILMQYTGLKDKNGREIYEGDVLKWEVAWVEPTTPWKQIFEVKIPEIYYAQNDENWPGGLNENECEVIGNIYENPELMPKTKE